MTPEWSLAEAASNLAELGYDGIEWRVQTLPRNLPQDAPFDYWGNNRSTVDLERVIELAPEIRRITEGAGLEFCSLATYLYAEQLDEIERVMRAAQIMGCPRMRVQTPPYERTRNYNDLYAETTEYLRQVEVLARQYGVQANIETHMGGITVSAALAHRLVAPFDPEYIGVIYDPGNMMHEGYECWRMGLELLGPYLHEVHAKNGFWEQVDRLPEASPYDTNRLVDANTEDGTLLWRPHYAALRAGYANWQEIMGDLAEIGYDGWIAFEDFTDDEGATWEKCARNLAYLKSYE
jgi:sugar phosphate isomerase/epimerase